MSGLFAEIRAAKRSSRLRALTMDGEAVSIAAIRRKHPSSAAGTGPEPRRAGSGRLSEYRGPLARFPCPGQQIVDALGRVIRQPRQDVGQPRLGIDVVELCGLDQRVDSGGAVAARVGATECPVAPSDGDAAQGAFGRIVRQADPPIVEEPGEGCPMVQAVAD